MLIRLHIKNSWRSAWTLVRGVSDPSIVQLAVLGSRSKIKYWVTTEFSYQTIVNLMLLTYWVMTWSSERCSCFDISCQLNQTPRIHACSRNFRQNTRVLNGKSFWIKPWWCRWVPKGESSTVIQNGWGNGLTSSLRYQYSIPCQRYLNSKATTSWSPTPLLASFRKTNFRFQHEISLPNRILAVDLLVLQSIWFR